MCINMTIFNPTEYPPDNVTIINTINGLQAQGLTSINNVVVMRVTSGNTFQFTYSGLNFGNPEWLITQYGNNQYYSINFDYPIPSAVLSEIFAGYPSTNPNSISCNVFARPPDTSVGSGGATAGDTLNLSVSGNLFWSIRLSANSSISGSTQIFAYSSLLASFGNYNGGTNPYQIYFTQPITINSATTLWSGNTIPSNSLNANSGDYYFQTNNPSNPQQTIYIRNGSVWDSLIPNNTPPVYAIAVQNSINVNTSISLNITPSATGNILVMANSSALNTNVSSGMGSLTIDNTTTSTNIVSSSANSSVQSYASCGIQTGLTIGTQYTITLTTQSGYIIATNLIVKEY